MVAKVESVTRVSAVGVAVATVSTAISHSVEVPRSVQPMVTEVAVLESMARSPTCMQLGMVSIVKSSR